MARDAPIDGPRMWPTILVDLEVAEMLELEELLAGVVGHDDMVVEKVSATGERIVPWPAAARSAARKILVAIDVANRQGSPTEVS